MCQRRGKENQVPHSLPSQTKSWSSIESASFEDGTVTQNSVPRAASEDSGPLWAAVSPARVVPAVAQFDENEFLNFEEGEVEAEAEEEAPPPPNQEANRRKDVETPREHAARREDVLGEHRRSHFPRDDEPTARKRSWTGSAVSEEDRRTARRPRFDRHEQTSRPMLPPIKDLMGNPWRGVGEGEFRIHSFASPVSTSTPRLPPYARDEISFHHDEQAEVSGHPPTLRGSSIDSPTSVRSVEEDIGRTRSHSRSGSLASAPGMEVDYDADLNSNSLLEVPYGQRSGAGIPREDGRKSLQEILAEETPYHRTRNERDQNEFWRSGYRPKDWTQSRVPRERKEDDEYERSHFSPLPNTKAWEYARGARRQDFQTNYGRPAMARSEEAAPGEEGEDVQSMLEDGRRSTSYAQRAGGSRHNTLEAEEREQDRDVPLEWWQETKASRLPTILMKEESVEDVPVVVDSPHSDRWTTHLSDPEERYAGMSKEWMKAIWTSLEPIVLLTVFNYRYTKNQEINRHIETCISSMTTQLTGESGFHVVQPDPEWRHDLKARDLPYLWVIRGLSEQAAWEMVKSHVISARGVSIITHPKTIENPRFVCGLAGFLRPDVKTTKKAVLNVLESEYMVKRLTELVHSSDRLSHLPIRKRVERVIESLDVRFIATKEDGYVANIYILPPTDEMDEWREWADEMRSCKYNVFLNGTGSARKAFWCGGCRGVDHEDQECPIPKMRGWKGPLAGARSHSKYWEPESIATKRPGRGRGGPQWSGMNGQPLTRTPGASGRGVRDGWTGSGSGRGRGGQRGAYSSRGSHDQRGGMRSNWDPRTPAYQNVWNARF